MSILLKVPDTVESMFHAFKNDLSTMFDKEPAGRDGFKGKVKVANGIPLNEFPTVNDDPECL
jgi:hypothetical protein